MAFIPEDVLTIGCFKKWFGLSQVVRDSGWYSKVEYIISSKFEFWWLELQKMLLLPLSGWMCTKQRDSQSIYKVSIVVTSLLCIC